jgi:thiol-disulfide isomerase/thioredoxin
MKQLPRDFNIRAPGRPCLVFVHVEWCGHCRSAKPVMQRVADILGSVVPVYSVDADERPDLARAWNVAGFPTILFAKDGEVYRYDGRRTHDAISSFVCHSWGSTLRPDVCTRYV